MKYVKDYKDGDRMFDIYFCKYKSSAVTKNGKNYDNVILQDRTGTIDAKIWEPNNVGIGEFEVFDYIEVYGDVISFNGALQVNVKRVRKCNENEYDEREYMPISKKNIDEMFAMFESFTKYLDPIISFIKYASEALYQMKFFSLVIIITLFFAIYIPKMIIPVTLLTVIFCFIDHFLGNHISKWNNSLYRQIFYYIYALTCFSYPAYLIIKYIIESIKFISSLMSSDVKERRIKKKKN